MAVIVRLSASPAVGVALAAVGTNLAAVAAATVTASGVAVEIAPSLASIDGRAALVELHHAVGGGGDRGDTGGEGERSGGAEGGRRAAAVGDGRDGPVGTGGSAAEGDAVRTGVGGDGAAFRVLGGDRQVVGGAGDRRQRGGAEHEVMDRADRDGRRFGRAARGPGAPLGGDDVGVGAGFEPAVGAGDDRERGRAGPAAFSPLRLTV